VQSLLLMLRKLEEEAQAAGGAIHFINGNHEVLNVAGDFRYVTPGAMRESEEFHARLVESFGSTLAMLGDQLPQGGVAFKAEGSTAYNQYMARVALFSPGGAVAVQLAQHNSVLIVNDTLFTHGGISRAHLEVGLDNLNRAMSAWMRGNLPPELEEALYEAKGHKDSLVWNRNWGRDSVNMRSYQLRLARGEMRDILEQASLEAGAPVNRIVVGHTVQQLGANADFDNCAWRMDVGVSRGVAGASPEVLEIECGQEPRILRYPPGQNFTVSHPPKVEDTEFEPLCCNLFDHNLLLRSEI